MSEKPMHLSFDERGWPIRLREDGERVCFRPECRTERYAASTEFRIDGFCSAECRDLYDLEDLEVEIAALRADVVALHDLAIDPDRLRGVTLSEYGDAAIRAAKEKR